MMTRRLSTKRTTGLEPATIVDRSWPLPDARAIVLKDYRHAMELHHHDEVVVAVERRQGRGAEPVPRKRESAASHSSNHCGTWIRMRASAIFKS